MTPITDMNEVTYHALEVISTHLFNTKGPLPGKSSVGGGAAVAQPMNVSFGEYDGSSSSRNALLFFVVTGSLCTPPIDVCFHCFTALLVEIRKLLKVRTFV